MTPLGLADLVVDLLTARTGPATGSSPVPVLVAASTDPHRGDFTTPAVLQVAAAMALDPWPLARAVAERLRPHPDVAEVVAARPGHLNVTATVGSLVRTARAAATSTPAWAQGIDDARLPPPWQDLARAVGEDVARWWWVVDPEADPTALDPRALTTRRFDNPVFAVLYARARAAGEVRVAGAGGAGADVPLSPEAYAGTRRRVLVTTADLLGPTLRVDPAQQRRGLLRRVEAVAAAYLDLEASPGVPRAQGPTSDGDAARTLLAGAVGRLLDLGCARLGIQRPERI